MPGSFGSVIDYQSLHAMEEAPSTLPQSQSPQACCPLLRIPSKRLLLTRLHQSGRPIEQSNTENVATQPTPTPASTASLLPGAHTARVAQCPPSIPMISRLREAGASLASPCSGSGSPSEAPSPSVEGLQSSPTDVAWWGQEQRRRHAVTDLSSVRSCEGASERGVCHAVTVVVRHDAQQRQAEQVGQWPCAGGMGSECIGEKSASRLPLAVRGREQHERLSAHSLQLTGGGAKMEPSPAIVAPAAAGAGGTSLAAAAAGGYSNLKDASAAALPSAPCSQCHPPDAQATFASSQRVTAEDDSVPGCQQPPLLSGLQLSKAAAAVAGAGGERRMDGCCLTSSAVKATGVHSQMGREGAVVGDGGAGGRGERGLSGEQTEAPVSPGRAAAAAAAAVPARAPAAAPPPAAAALPARSPPAAAALPARSPPAAAAVPARSPAAAPAAASLAGPFGPSKAEAFSASLGELAGKVSMLKMLVAMLAQVRRGAWVTAVGHAHTHTHVHARTHAHTHACAAWPQHGHSKHRDEHARAPARVWLERP